MRVEILQPIAGLFETDYSDVIPGDIVDIDEAHAERYAAQKPPLCQPADPKAPITTRALSDIGRRHPPG